MTLEFSIIIVLMPPQQPYYTPPPQPAVPPTPSQPQYDFIMQPAPQSSGDLLTKFIGTSTSVRIAAAAGAVGVILIIIMLVAVILSGNNGLNTTALISVAQKQTELARISSDPSTSATQQPTKNFAATASLTLISDQQALVNFLSLHGSKPSTSTLAASKSANTDSKLQDSQTNGTYDSTYLSIARTQLASYEKSLQIAAAGSKSKTEQQLLSAAYIHAQLLVEQSQSH